MAGLIWITGYIILCIKVQLSLREIENGTTKALGLRHIDCFDDRETLSFTQSKI
jgi:hypothetical protein